MNKACVLEEEHIAKQYTHARAQIHQLRKSMTCTRSVSLVQSWAAQDELYTPRAATHKAHETCKVRAFSLSLPCREQSQSEMENCRGSAWPLAEAGGIKDDGTSNELCAETQWGEKHIPQLLRGCLSHRDTQLAAQCSATAASHACSHSGGATGEFCSGSV